jgi:hypothetical protein
MKDIGKTTKMTVKELIRIRMGHFTRENGFKICNMDMGLRNIQMDQHLQEIINTGSSKELESSFGLTDPGIKENLTKIK